MDIALEDGIHAFPIKWLKDMVSHAEFRGPKDLLALAIGLTSVPKCRCQ